MTPKPYYRRWSIWLRGELLGEVLAATEQAACLRAIQRFKIGREDQRELQVRTAARGDSRRALSATLSVVFSRDPMMRPRLSPV